MIHSVIFLAKNHPTMVRIWGNFRSMTLIQVGKDIVIDEEDEDQAVVSKIFGIFTGEMI